MTAAEHEASEVLRSYLLRWLALPLLLIAVASLLGSYLVGMAGVSLLQGYLPSGWLQDLLLGLSTTFLGFLITVFFVEKVLKDYEQRQWTPVRRLVVGELLSAGDCLGARLARFADAHVPSGDPRRGSWSEAR